MTGPRVRWIDATKGVALTSLVLMHAAIFAHLPFVNGNPELFWRWYSSAIAPFMLPALFFLSGAMRPWLASAPLLSRRTLIAAVQPLWLYGAWYVVYAVARQAGIVTGAAPLSEPTSLIARFFAPASVLWFLAAMALWTVIVPLLRRLPTSVVIALIAVAASSWYWMPGVDGVDQYLRIVSFGAFFAFGVYLREPVFAAMNSARARYFVVALIVFLACLFLRGQDQSYALLAATFVPWCASAAFLLMFVIALVTRVPRVGSALAWIGRYTLPFYVVHTLVFLTLATIPAWETLVTSTTLTRWTSPVIATVIAGIVTIALYWACQNRYLRWVFTPPFAARGSSA